MMKHAINITAHTTSPTFQKRLISTKLLTIAPIVSMGLLSFTPSSAALMTMNYEASIHTEFLDDGPPIDYIGLYAGSNLQFEIQMETDPLMNPNRTSADHLYEAELASFSVTLDGREIQATDGFFRAQQYGSGDSGSIMFWGTEWNGIMTDPVSGQPSSDQTPIGGDAWEQMGLNLDQFTLSALFDSEDVFRPGAAPSLDMASIDLTMGETYGILHFSSPDGRFFKDIGARDGFANMSSTSAPVSEPISLSLLALGLGLLGCRRLSRSRTFLPPLRTHHC